MIMIDLMIFCCDIKLANRFGFQTTIFGDLTLASGGFLDESRPKRCMHGKLDGFDCKYYLAPGSKYPGRKIEIIQDTSPSVMLSSIIM